MLKNHLLIALRNLSKNNVFIGINVLGMSIAVGCCIVAYYAMEYDQRFDQHHEYRESVYRIGAERTFDGQLTHFGRVPLALGTAVTSAFQNVDASSRYVVAPTNLKRHDELFAADITYVDPGFFDMFSFEFIAGNASGIADPSSMVISETMAVRLFETAQQALGKTLTQVTAHGERDVKIAAVFREQPMNSSFYQRNGSAFQNFTTYDNNHNIKEDDWFTDASVFVRINAPADIPLVERQLKAFTERNNEVRQDFRVTAFTLDPFASMAHSDRDENVQAQTWSAPPVSAIISSAIMSVLILLIACFNLANTAIALSTRRLKEIGIRKVMGSRRLHVALQFIGETTLICLLALIVGLAFADVLIAGWNRMTAGMIYLKPDYFGEPGFIFFLLAILLATGIIAGCYPAIYLSRFQPVTILKGKLKLGNTNNFTRVLLGLQFTISLISIVTAIGFLQNARYQEAYDLGFDVRGTIVTWVNDKGEFDTYRNALTSNSDISAIAGARGSIFTDRMRGPVKHASREVEVDIIEVGDNYLHTIGLDLIAGRDFIANSETDVRESVIITQNMADLFGWNDPLGKEILWRDSVRLYVTGVIRDVYTHGLWREMEPMMIRYVLPDRYTQLIVNTQAEKITSVNAFMASQWSTVFPGKLYNGYVMGHGLDESSRLNRSIVAGNGFLGTMALLLSVTGLYALVSLNMNRRLKEIGIRKIAGASILNIARRVNREFIVILVIASVTGSYAGYMWCNTILSSIWKYHQPAGSTTFIFATATMLTVSLGAIAYRVLSIANANPVDTLRDE